MSKDLILIDTIKIEKQYKFFVNIVDNQLGIYLNDDNKIIYIDSNNVIKKTIENSYEIYKKEKEWFNP
jgi:hypothetical protein